MDIQQITNFLKLADELHFWNTASIMNITQSALSRQIQALEEELGLQLFERNKRNVRLTASGAFLRDKWAVLLDDLNYVHLFARKINEGETGSITIAHPDSISYSLLPDLVFAIANQHAELTIELIQLLYENVQESLRDYKIDMAFTRQVNILPGISSRKIKTEPVAFFVPDNHPFRGCDDITAESLAAQRFILPVAERKSSYHFIVQEIFKSYGVVPQAHYQSDFGSSILGLVSKGLGIAILPLDFLHHCTPGVRVIEIPFNTDLYIHWRTDDKNPSLRNILKIADELYKTIN
ncbi:LysR substrate-binding domain-containing protein [Pedobacter sp. L105]|uniref:LysR substrate-binding domain-containing protein n=1 Tax=Pedobacter sp. L105 TaxID=1641871 RepID=UPI00131C66CA|nr:LysR substrate-binding domain-containing protein [Pedobacter sp. L105]